ncbi:uncharacterized protein LOC119737671 [Patiria miniata]|uniref:Uncharacterized protein n=1 Tax=Patiria miniata TaxID=46514 RepID=A0A914AWM0_PATMI|nr:uncharacterized protein LOC119737671 [Patiria miniata]
MGKTKPVAQRRTRSSAGDSSWSQFTKSCKCIMHDVFKTSESPKLFNIALKSHPTRKLQWLLDKKYLSPRAKHVCIDCLDQAPSTSGTGSKRDTTGKKDPSQLPEEEEPSNSESAIVGEILNLIANRKLSQESVTRVCSALGNLLSSDILQDSKAVQGSYKNLENLLDLNCVEYLGERPPALVSFLSSISNVTIDKDQQNAKKTNGLCLVIENIYALRNANFVGPLSFSQGLVKWSINGSKTTHALDGASSASGSVTSLKKVLQNSSAKSNVCFSSGDVDVFADNTQRIGKTGRVRTGGTTPANVVTNVVFIQSRPASNLQTQGQLAPSHWLDKTEDVADKITAFEKELNDNVFRPYRHMCQSKFIEQVKSELHVDDITGESKDHVYYSCSAQEQDCVCPKCCKVYDKVTVECPGCGYNPVNVPDRSSMYGDVPSCHSKEKPAVKMGEIIPINPNSKATIKEVLLNLKQQAGVGTDRSWIRVGFDGVPYRIANLLIKNTIMCEVCNEHIDISVTPFDAHCEIKHPGVYDIGSKKLLDDILLTPGAGHAEINLLRAIFSLTRVIFMEHIAGCLGFCSKRAKDFVIRGSNHHVTWQIFDIVLKAFALELCYTYVSQNREENENFLPTAEDFVMWKNTRVINPNFNLIYDLIFHIFLGVKCFRSGIRRNNSQHAIAGRQKTAPIMYIGKHGIYQPLLFRDMQVRVEAPPDIKKYIEENEAFSRSGNNLRGEGGDYVTENENRSLKSILPPGVPTVERWQMASRCSANLQKNRKAVFQRAGFQDPGEQRGSVFNRELEVQAIRKEIRLSGMLKNPYEEIPLKSIEGKLLHQDFVNVYNTALENYDAYKKSPHAPNLQPVFVTSEDEQMYNDMNNWTARKLTEETMKLLEQFSDQDSADMYREMHSDVAKAAKSVKIQFYQDISQILNLERELLAFGNEDIEQKDDDMEQTE